MSLFAPAQRSQSRARIGIAGPSGSGKTYTALTIAAGLGGKTAVLDTERGSASLYAGDFSFDVAELHPPFTAVKYLEALREAADAGYQTVIIDSITHAWKGEGGVLDEVDAQKVRQRGGNDFTAWKHGDKLWRSLIDAMLAAPLHVIVTMRSKTEYVMEEDSRGRNVPRKIGMAPEARDGIEYEFTLVMDMDHEHRAVVSKSRMREFADAVIDKPGPDVGERIAGWLGEGAASTADRAAFDAATEPVEHDRLLAELEDWMQFVPQEHQGEARAYARKGVGEARETIDRARNLAPSEAVETAQETQEALA